MYEGWFKDDLAKLGCSIVNGTTGDSYWGSDHEAGLRSKELIGFERKQRAFERELLPASRHLADGVSDAASAAVKLGSGERDRSRRGRYRGSGDDLETELSRKKLAVMPEEFAAASGVSLRRSVLLSRLHCVCQIIRGCSQAKRTSVLEFIATAFPSSPDCGERLTPFRRD